MRKSLDKIFWGLFFVLGAVFILVSRMGYLQDVNVLTLVFAVFLAGCFIKSLINVEFTGVCFSLALLAILFDDELGITAITPWPVLGAALLASIGLNMLFHKHHHYCHIHDGKEFDKDCETVNVEDGSQINFSTSFGASIKYINTDDFKSANLDCSFGAMKVYFDNAVIQGDRAVVNIHASFAGMELYIPKEWRVENHARISLGALDEKNRSQTTGSPVLAITGDASFCGIEIFYV